MKFLFIIICYIALHATTIQDYKKECVNNNYQSCYEFGMLCLYEENEEFCKQEIEEFSLKKACDNGIGEACSELSSYYFMFAKDLSADYEIKACEKGFGEACYMIGDRSEPYPSDVTKDFSRALRYHKKGCNSGYEKSCVSYNKLILDEKKEKGKSLYSSTYAGIKMYSSTKNNSLISSNNHRIVNKIAGLEGYVSTSKNDIIEGIFLYGDMLKPKAEEYLEKLNAKYRYIDQKVENSTNSSRTHNIKINKYQFKNGNDTIFCIVKPIFAFGIKNYFSIEIQYLSKEYIRRIQKMKQAEERERSRRKEKYSKELDSL